ncbi:hypothetical protein ACTFIW_000773 [Dictyostelium discoideum]
MKYIRLNRDIEIKSIEFAINNTVNSSTGHTPLNYNLPYLEATEYYRQAARDNMVYAQIKNLIYKFRFYIKYIYDNINNYYGHRTVHVSYMKPDDRRIFKSSDSNYKPLDKRNRMIGEVQE